MEKNSNFRKVSLEINKLIRKHNSFLIIGSLRLDFDSLASGLIMKKYLESLGKKARFVYPREMTSEENQFNSFLPYFDEIISKDTRKIIDESQEEVLILVDGVNLIQFYDSRYNSEPTPNIQRFPIRIQIDHHLNNVEQLGTHAIIDSSLSCTVEVIFTHLISRKFIDKQIAELAYPAIVEDTGNLRWGFATGTLNFLGLLLEKGADPQPAINHYFFFKTKGYLSATAYAINNLEYDDDIRTTFLFLPSTKIENDKISPEQLKNISNAYIYEVAHKINEYPLTLCVVEKEPGLINISGRGSTSDNIINIPQLLKNLGGNAGGHFNSAGTQLQGDFEETKQKLKQFISEALKNAKKDK